MPKYADLSKYSFILSSILLGVGFCIGLPINLVLCSVLLLCLGSGFFLVQGRYKKGFVFALGMFIVSFFQYIYGLSFGFWFLSCCVGILIGVLQIIELVFKKHSILDEIYGE